MAKIYLDFLEDKLTPKAINNALDKFQRQNWGSDSYDRSQVLANAFDDAMQRVNAQSPGRRELALQVLGWITFAWRALTTLELRHALAVELNQPEFDENNLADIQDLVSVCAGLVTIDEESMAIRLVHYTLQEYLENTQDKWFRNPQAQMALKCVTYLSFSAFESGRCRRVQDMEERLRLHPFYHYAACNWGHHAREAETPYGDIEYFLCCQKKVEACSQLLPYSPILFGRHGRRKMYGLHLAAYFGIDSVVSGQLVNTDPNSRDGNGRTPISYAVQNGHVAVVQLLLEHGADANLNYEFGSASPLLIAAFSGHLAIVKLLLDKGAKVDSKNEYGGTALWHAMVEGHKAVVELLLEKGANIDSKDINEQTPLMAAAIHGDASMVMFLLEKGADINTKDRNRRTSLWLASKKPDAAIVKLLLEKGAHVDPQDDDEGKTPLMWAAMRGKESLVSLLLQNGANCTIKDNNGRTPLSWAEEKGYKTIVQMLKRQR